LLFFLNFITLNVYIHTIEGKMNNKSIHSSTRRLGERIRQERKSQNLSQTELAQLCGVSLNFLSQLELGKPTVRLNKVIDVMGILGLEFNVQYGKQGIKT